MVDVETLAKALHEAGREAVEKGLVVNKVPNQPFFGWDMITPEARDGRRVQAQYLLNHFHVLDRSDPPIIVQIQVDSQSLAQLVMDEMGRMWRLRTST